MVITMIDREELTKNDLHHWRQVIREINKLSTLEEREKYYNAHSMGTRSAKTGQEKRHVMNWLFTLKAETQLTGIDFIDFVLVTLQKTMRHRELNNEQFFMCKLLSFLYIECRREYMQNKAI